MEHPVAHCISQLFILCKCFIKPNAPKCQNAHSKLMVIHDKLKFILCFFLFHVQFIFNYIYQVSNLGQLLVTQALLLLSATKARTSVTYRQPKRAKGEKRKKKVLLISLRTSFQCGEHSVKI